MPETALHEFRHVAGGELLLRGLDGRTDGFLVNAFVRKHRAAALLALTSLLPFRMEGRGFPTEGSQGRLAEGCLALSQQQAVHDDLRYVRVVARDGDADLDVSPNLLVLAQKYVQDDAVDEVVLAVVQDAANLL